MLHIVNGDSVGDKLRQGIVPGDILVWREVLSEGPIFANPSTDGNRAIRAEYLEKTMGIPAAEFITISQEQEKRLAQFHHHDEVILWFEYDLFDQTILCYLLHWLAKQSLSQVKLSLVSLDSFPGIEDFRGLGQLSVEQLQTLVGTWRPIGQAELDLGTAIWQAYCSPDPLVLDRLLKEGSSFTALPFARKSYLLHLARFPSTYNGLGIVEQTTLELVDDGIRSPIELFRLTGSKLHGLGMGDLQYWYILDRMSRGTFPLLKCQGLNGFPDYLSTSLSLHHATVEITPFGEAVLEGKEDWAAANEIDVWYGGVHLCGHTIPWRWDRSLQSIVSV